MMTDILKRHPMKLTTCFVATDYTCSPSTKDSNLDFYFIPGHEFATDFECSTITEDKLIASGIPVRQMFYDSSEKEKAKSNEGVAPHHKHMIMMCGSMGCGPMQKLIHKLSVDLPANWEISVICGNNRIHFIRNGGAKTGATTDEIVDVCQVLMKNDEKRRRMSHCLNHLEKYNSAKIIYDQLKKSTEDTHATD